ncbi:MAG: hypothetical protein LBJ40_15210 [Delftia acidovorans]|uniref:hypothetical protein n=1 Tax=Delftia acidovorans TaxID=80866 RepID=UPI0028323E8B|nr:hypothetical protein [Delftia acidovorans]MDR3017417.1 hypothetical protein [Delftia acidovorans]
MIWKKITDNELSNFIDAEIKKMPANLKLDFDKIKVELHREDCIRNNLQEKNGLYIVANHRQKKLIYDDVEDEFGITKSYNNKIIECWDLFPTLESAIKKLLENKKSE